MTDQGALLGLVSRTQRGVLVTIKSDGRPQLSNIMYGFDDEAVRISVTDTRAKTRNLRRDPRASLYVTSDDFWSYAVVEGTAVLSPVTTDPGDATSDELVKLYRSLRGEHPDWDDYRRAMVDEGRLVVRIPVGRVYGMAGSP